MLMELSVMEQRYQAVLEVLVAGSRSPRWPSCTGRPVP